VVVTDGTIESCTYDFANPNIIIPDTLDGQVVLEINEQVFENKEMVHMVLPASLQNIGQFAFRGNDLKRLDLSECRELDSIQEGAFTDAGLEEVDFTGCSSLSFIGDEAFSYNSLVGVDLASCYSLSYIGRFAFYGNSMEAFMLPVLNIPGLEVEYWSDLAGNIYEEGDIVHDLETVYFIVSVRVYTVRIVVNDGSIAIPGAEVILGDYGSAITDADGLAVFSGIRAEIGLELSVSAPGFDARSVTLSVQDGDVTVVITLSPVTGIKSDSGGEFKLYPNPASDLVYLVLPAEATLRILDLTGSLLFIGDFREGVVTLNIEHLPAGIYLFRVSAGDKVYTKRVVIE
jgi:hypothetical protein